MITTPDNNAAARPSLALNPLLSEPNDNKSIRLVLVDDDNDYREVARDELAYYGFDVTDFDDSPPAIDYFRRGNSSDVIVLDWNLPTMAGIDIVPQLHRLGIRVPVIILTALSGTGFEIAALERGALDFVNKLRGIPVLAKRASLIATAAKHPTEGPIEEVLDQGPLKLRPRVSRAYWRGIDVGLTITEFNIVRRLVDSVGDHVSYRSIYDCVHQCGFIAGSGDNGYRTNVRSLVKRIRNKFREIDPEFEEIENFTSFGYCWRNSHSPQ